MYEVRQDGEIRPVLPFFFFFFFFLFFFSFLLRLSYSFPIFFRIRFVRRCVRLKRELLHIEDSINGVESGCVWVEFGVDIKIYYKFMYFLVDFSMFVYFEHNLSDDDDDGDDDD